MSDCRECSRELLGNSETEQGVCNACEGSEEYESHTYFDHDTQTEKPMNKAQLKTLGML